MVEVWIKLLNGFFENSDPSVGYKMVTSSDDKSAGSRINKCIFGVGNPSDQTKNDGK